MDIRFRIHKLPEGAYEAWVFRCDIPEGTMKDGEVIYASTVGQLNAKFAKRIKSMKLATAIIEAEK